MSGIRKLIKCLLAFGLYYTGLLHLYSWVRRKFCGGAHHVILMYHRVLDNINADDVFTQPGMSVSTTTFDKQLKYLRSRFAVLTVSGLAEQIENGSTKRNPTAVITFDDGWRDNYTNAYPSLHKHGLPATIFLTTDYVGTSRPFWFLMIKWILSEGNLTKESFSNIVADIAEESSSDSEGLAELVHVIKGAGLNSDKIIEACKQLELDTLDRLIDAMRQKSKLSLEYWESARPMLTWDEAIEMSRAGVEIGSHGCSHRILTLLPPPEISKELSDSKRVIEENLGAEITSFSYPNGDFDDEIKVGVKEAGYRCAVATGGRRKNAGNRDAFALRRIAVHEGISTGMWGGFSKAMFAWHIIRHS